MRSQKDLVLGTTQGATTTEYQASVAQLREELTKYGLTLNQSKVYIFLGKHGSKTAPEVCKALKLPRTETYHLLTSLQNRGIVSATFQHPIKFRALPLDKAVWTLVNAEKERVKTLEKKEENLTKLWNDIPDFDEGTELQKEEKFQMLQGVNQIFSKVNELITSAKKEILILGSEKDISRLYHADFLNTSNPISVRILSTSNLPENIVSDIPQSMIKKTRMKTKGILCFIVKDDDDLVFFTKNSSHSAQNSFAMWANSPSMIYANKLLFDCMWKKSKSC